MLDITFHAKLLETKKLSRSIAYKAIDCRSINQAIRTFDSNEASCGKQKSEVSDVNTSRRGGVLSKMRLHGYHVLHTVV